MVINANYFFLAIAAVLLAILLFFKPTDVPEMIKNGKEVPALELHNFTLYELDQNGLKDIMIGKRGYRYKKRLEIVDINYTDSTRTLQNNLLADFGVYNNIDLITLEGNVRYHREDGMHFVTDRAIVNQKKETIDTKGPFKLYKFADNVVGDNLFYDSKKGLTHAKNVTGIFELDNLKQ